MVSPFAWFKWVALFGEWRVFAEGFGITILVSLLGLGLALALGIFFGMFGASHWKGPRFLTRCYVEFIQNTPLVIQVFFIYNGLPYLGIVLPVLIVGIVGVGVYHGAYIAEVIRGEFRPYPKGSGRPPFPRGSPIGKLCGLLFCLRPSKLFCHP